MGKLYSVFYIGERGIPTFSAATILGVLVQDGNVEQFPFHFDIIPVS